MGVDIPFMKLFYNIILMVVMSLLMCDCDRCEKMDAQAGNKMIFILSLVFLQGNK